MSSSSSSSSTSASAPTPQKVSLDGVGTTNVWGFSRALDLQQESHYLSETPLQELKDPSALKENANKNERMFLSILSEISFIPIVFIEFN
jgi:hypothetical protein